MVVAGISEYARRIRELRVELGWQILSGVTVADMLANASDDDRGEIDSLPKMKPDEYLLINTEQDRDAAHRWESGQRHSQTAEPLHARSNIALFERKRRSCCEWRGIALCGKGQKRVGTTNQRTEKRTRLAGGATKSNGRPDLPVGDIYT